ncbi:MAG: tRNA dihydrouridine synthase DusB [Bacillota bacterium]|nr:tRNA dihydrouridine synthase DusB [Bacillota bacterium]
MQYKTFLKENPLVLAPMAGVSDLSFRMICREFGAGITVSEMVSSKALYYKDSKTSRLMQLSKEDRPCGIQIFGSDPEIMAYAAKVAEEKEKPDFIDINMGCPVPKIVNNGDGSSLMKSPELIYEIVKAVCNAVEIPVSVKIRAGFYRNDLNAPVCAQAAEAAGACAVSVHGKSREQYYAPSVNLEIIKQVKETVKIPVIGNGDIFSAEDVINMQKVTGCDGIMIGRGSLGNPFIFREVYAALKNETYVPPTVAERMNTAKKHMSMLVGLKGEHIGVQEARKHMAWYLKGVRGSASLRDRINRMTTLTEILEIADEVIRAEMEGC